MFDGQRPRWLEIADALAPSLCHRRFEAARTVRPVRDAAAFQGWRMDPAGPGRDIPITGDPAYLDFDRHLVGEVRLHVSRPLTADECLWVRFGETPAEVCEDAHDMPGKLGGEWLAPVALSPDSEGWAVAPARRALRYARIWIERTGPERVGLDPPPRLIAAHVIAQTSAAWEDPPLWPDMPAWQIELDRIALHTLRNCMQAVFEDGPKRDRRLWLGDLYLQAKTAYVSFGGHDLVKRCLYLFAATCGEDGTISPCVFAKPTWHGNHIRIPGYAWLFAPTLLDYVQATGDLDTAADLWDLALAQFDLFDRHADTHGVFDPPRDTVWRFVDWHESLDPQPAEQAIAVYGLNSLIRLAPLAGRPAAARDLRQRRDRWVQAARAAFYDDATGLMRGRTSGQLSWATHAWMILAGIIRRAQAAPTLERLHAATDVLPPVTPYMHHYVLAAMFRAGQREQAWSGLRTFWGAMADRGATTFWEIWDPADDRRSPYASHLHNSYCHAWSCTPSWFIRHHRPVSSPPSVPRRQPLATSPRQAVRTPC